MIVKSQKCIGEVSQSSMDEINDFRIVQSCRYKDFSTRGLPIESVRVPTQGPLRNRGLSETFEILRIDTVAHQKAESIENCDRLPKKSLY